jgi:hypothetical protein
LSVDGSTIVGGLVLLAVAAVAFKILRGGLGDATFVVTVESEGSEGIKIQGDVPGYSAGEVAEFVAGLQLPIGAKVWGIPDRDRIRLRFSATVPETLHQRMRNFFYAPF